MKISHEVPIDLFHRSIQFNDYPYVLGHLIKLDSEYREFYKHQLSVSSFSILDNSAFELGKSIPFDELMSVARELKPSHLVLPDTVHDKETTLKNSIDFWEEFTVELGMLDITPIGVVQGNSFEDLYECILKYTSSGIFYIAIPFDCIKGSDYGQIRFQFFKYLLKKLQQSKELGQLEIGVLDIHFLGLQNPQELLLYTEDEKQLITSIDSSSPILHGISGNEFTKWGCLSEKPKMKLADNLEMDVSEEQWVKIQNNINHFKKFCNE